MRNNYFKPKSIIVAVLLQLNFLSSGCDNKVKVNQSKDSSNEETIKIDEEKRLYKETIDSLSKEIKKLELRKENAVSSLNIAEAEVHNILKKSFFDHIIIGTEELEKTKDFFNNTLGFSVKEGRKHSNGIINFFIEFADGSEIEIVSIDNPKSSISAKYQTLIKNNKFGLQFALRTNHIDQLSKLFETLDSDYSIYDANKSYSTLSKKNFTMKSPLFFIQHHTENNSLTEHKNNTHGVTSVWLSTKNLRESISNFSNLGFTLIDTVSVANFKSRTALMQNDNFNIIIIEAYEYEIIGMTIKSDNVEQIKNELNSKLKEEFKIKKSKRGKSLYLSPKYSNSIWIELIEY